MNEKHQRAFLLFFSGYPQKEIAADLNTNVSNVSVILNFHAAVWIEEYLRAEYKERILELASQNKNSQQIADIMGRPWNRYNVTFVLRKLKLRKKKMLANSNRNNQTQEAKALKFRCSMCSRPYEQTMEEANLNPDRLCVTTTTHYGCIDRRVDERRGLNRVDITS